MRGSIDPSLGWTGEGKNVCWSLRARGSVHRGLQVGHARAEPGKEVAAFSWYFLSAL